MNDEEFARYIDNSIDPLFPNLEDMPGKCILLVRMQASSAAIQVFTFGFKLL